MNTFVLFLCSFLFACSSLIPGVYNPVHCLLLLIILFAVGSILLFLLNMEIFAIIFLTVYIGAIVVLFLFIIMMLDIKTPTSLKQKFSEFFSYPTFYVLFFLSFFFTNILDWSVNFKDIFHNSFYYLDNNFDVFSHEYTNYAVTLNYVTYIKILGKVLYDTNIIPFLLASILLFCAMVGAIVITLDSDNPFMKKFVKQQHQGYQAIVDNLNILSLEIIKK